MSIINFSSYFAIMQTMLRSLLLGSLFGSIIIIGNAAPININEADLPTIIDNLVDIGPVKATAIIEYRELNGPFQTPEELLLVKGIGEKTLEKNRENLLFTNPDLQPAQAAETQPSQTP